MTSPDKNIFSGYIGRSLTGISALFIVAVTISAFITGGGFTRRSTIHICHLESAAAPSAAPAAVFRELLSAVVRQPVMLTPAAGVTAGECDLLIVPTFDWLLDPGEFEGVPIFALGTNSDLNGESALVIGRVGDEGSLATLSPVELQFTNHSSINGFWSQLELLQESNIHLPAHLDSFRYAGGDDGAYERVVVAVLSGSARFGACRGSVLRELENAGILAPNTLAVIARKPALPELLVISSLDNVTHYRTYLNRLREALAAGDSPGGNGAHALVLEELTPAVLEQMQSVGQLMGRYRGQL